MAPFRKTLLSPCVECHGSHWVIENEEGLASLVAQLLVGRSKHVQMILSNCDPKYVPPIGSAAIDDLVEKMTVATDTERYHRDGWVFQMITWIAAKAVEPDLMTAIPQSQSAMPGLDNLFVRTDGNKVTQVVIGEDKATINERDTIRDKVWPELRDFETGRRDHELLNEITPILERNSSELDVDECLQTLFWEKIRAYRVCITVKESKDLKGHKSLFKGYDTVAPGGHDKRGAESFMVGELRQWMDSFCEKIITELRSM